MFSSKLFWTFLLIIISATSLFAQAVVWEETFDVDNGWTLGSNWAIQNGNLQFSWTPSTQNYDLSAVSPAITLPANASEMIVNHYAEDYTTDTGEFYEIIITANGTDNVLWSWDMDTNDNWGVSGGENMVIPVNQFAGQTINIKFRSHGGDTYNINYWYIYNIQIMAAFNNDMAALTISGNPTPTQGESTPYTVIVKNSGLNPQSNYSVHLMQDGNTTPLVTVPGVALTQNQTHEFILNWTPAQAINTSIYGKVVLTNDEFLTNNQTALKPVAVQPIGTVAATIGDPASTTMTNVIPANFYFRNSLAQTLYMANEINAGGLITAISYHMSLEGDIPAERPFKIWMANTTVSSYEANTSWIPLDQFTLVFDGTVDLTATGDFNWVLPLQTPFAYGGSNLCIMTNRPMDTVYYSSMNQFYYTDTPNYPNRSLFYYSDGIEALPDNPPQGNVNTWVPNTVLFINTTGLGTLSGTITNQATSQPIENVRVGLNGSPRFTMTNAQGQYNMPYIPQGTVGITATKIGFVDYTNTNISITANQTTTLNFTLTQNPTCVVSGHVIGTDAPNGVDGATVVMTGYDTFTTTTDAQGNFSFPAIYQNRTYQISITKIGYLNYSAPVVTGTTNMVLPTITMTRVYYAYVGDEASTNWGNMLPINYFWKNSLSQTIYYPQELNIGGILTKIDYFFHHNGDIPAERPIKIWAAETDQTSFESGTSWIPVDQMTLVYDGTYTYTETGDQIMEIQLQTPYVYNGGNLVIMAYRPMDSVYYSSMNTFQFTQTPDFPNRSLYFYSDSTPCDPVAPPEGNLGDIVANTKLYFDIEGLGSLTGTVLNSQGNVPMEGVKVALNGTYRSTYTNASGVYNLNYLYPGTINITASKHGFYDATANNIVISADQQTTQNLTMNALPMVTVTGRIIGNDAPNGLQNAVVKLSGYETYDQNLTNAQGYFTISNVYASQTYNIKVSRPSYQTYSGTAVVGATNTTIPTITINELTNPPRNVHATDNSNSAAITWNSPSTNAEVEFRYDDGTAVGQLGAGSGTDNTVLGAVHRHNASLSQISWYLTAEGGPHATVNLFIFGLDGTGNPNGTDLLFSQMGVTNTDDQWNTFNIPSSVDAPNGFLVGLSYSGFAALGTDDGLDDPYPFIENTQFVSMDYQTQAFTAIENYGFSANFLIRAIGADNGPLDQIASHNHPAVKPVSPEAKKAPVHFILENRPLASIRQTNFSALTSSAQSVRSRTGYRVYRTLVENQANEQLWSLLGDVANTDSSYIDQSWGTAESGVYKYAIKAKYTGNIYSNAAFSNELAKNMMAVVNISLSTSNSLPVTGALVKLTNIDGNPEHIYQLTATSNTVVFPSVWVGTYTIEARLAGYTNYIANNIDINQSPFNYSIQLILSNLAFEDDFESYNSFVLEFTPWTLIDQDGLNTYGFTGITFPNSGMPMAYMIFTPSETTPALDTPVHSGAKLAACFAGQPAGAIANNNDWMITPQVNLGMNGSFNFYAKSYTDQYGLERFKVFAGTSPNPATMTQISPAPYVEAPVDWTNFTYSLSAYNNQNVYIAINCISADAFIFFVDDVQIERGSGNNIDPVIVTALNNNYPNPFNPETKISFALANKGPVTIDIYNIKGQKVKSLVNKVMEKGNHTVIWNGKDANNRNVSSGVYFYKMKSGTYSSTRKMILMK